MEGMNIDAFISDAVASGEKTSIYLLQSVQQVVFAICKAETTCDTDGIGVLLDQYGVECLPLFERAYALIGASEIASALKQLAASPASGELLARANKLITERKGYSYESIRSYVAARMDHDKKDNLQLLRWLFGLSVFMLSFLLFIILRLMPPFSWIAKQCQWCALVAMFVFPGGMTFWAFRSQASKRVMKWTVFAAAVMIGIIMLLLYGLDRSLSSAHFYVAHPVDPVPGIASGLDDSAAGWSGRSLIAAAVPA
jgi:hypothetical protein